MKVINGVKVPTAKDKDPRTPSPIGENPERSAKIEYEIYRGEKHADAGMKKHPQGGKLAQAQYHLAYNGKLPNHLKSVVERDDKAIQEHQQPHWKQD